MWDGKGRDRMGGTATPSPPCVYLISAQVAAEDGRRKGDKGCEGSEKEEEEEEEACRNGKSRNGI